ncbi:hypothetical protein DL768_001606 [Monosporascus sp. mg162]|nr:hypothetical protein DL768_001606 [Monosporascus sp. mg162]
MITLEYNRMVANELLMSLGRFGSSGRQARKRNDAKPQGESQRESAAVAASADQNVIRPSVQQLSKRAYGYAAL